MADNSSIYRYALLMPVRYALVIGLYLASVDLWLSLLVFGTAHVNSVHALTGTGLLYLAGALAAGLALGGIGTVLSRFSGSTTVPSYLLNSAAVVFLLFGCQQVIAASDEIAFALPEAISMIFMAGATLLCFAALFFRIPGFPGGPRQHSPLTGAVPGALLFVCTVALLTRTLEPQTQFGRMLLGLFFLVLASLALLLLRRRSGRKICVGLCLGAVGVLAVLSFLQSRPQQPRPVSPAETSSQPNLVLIICDALGAGQLTLYGGQTPARGLERLAKEGTLFSRAISTAPWTLPAMVSLFSERYPSVCSNGGIYRVTESFTTLAEDLRTQGYRTTALVGNYGLGRESGIHQGFEQSRLFYHHPQWSPRAMGLKELGLPTPFLRAWRVALARWRLDKNNREAVLPDTTKEITQEALERLGRPQTKRAPFFLWLHYMDPHDPFYPPESHREDVPGNRIGPFLAPHTPDLHGPQVESIQSRQHFLTPEDKEQIAMLYRGDVRYVGDHIERILDALREENLEENTLVVLTADHGEELWEHGEFYHGHSLYQELIHVPLIMRGPGIPVGQRYEERFSMVHLMPTLREALGIPAMQGSQGQSLWPAVTGSEAPRNTPCFSEGTVYDEPKESLTDRGFKLIRRRVTDEIELYHIESDPGESKNLWDSQSREEGMALLEQIDAWREQNESAKSSVEALSPSHVEEDLSRLQGLGYLR